MLRELAVLVGGEIVGDSDVLIAGIASLEKAGPGDLSFLGGAGYQDQYEATGAAAVLISPNRYERETDSKTVVLVDDPHEAVQILLKQLFPAPASEWGISQGVVIETGARWKGRVAIGRGSAIGSDSVLGENCRIGSQVIVGRGVTVGDECVISDTAVLCDGVVLGNRVSVLAGARVGTPGFGFVPGSSNSRRIPHPGGCILHDDVEVGANTTIDSGSVEATVIGARTKIDNLVQIAHNVQIGEDCILVAQVGLAGSTVLEDRVTVAGQAGLAGHLTVGTGARIGAQSGVIGDIAVGATVSGYPARNHREVLRQVAALRRITLILDGLESLVADDASE